MEVTLPAVLGAALVDSINPCAFALLLVFVAPLVAILALASSPPIYRKMARWQLHHRVSLKLATGVAAIVVGLLTLMVV